MKNKRGQEQLLMNIFYAIFIIAILVILLLFTKNATEKEDFKRQLVAKQISLLLDAAVPQTAFVLQHANMTLSKIDSSIEARTDLAFNYDFFNPYNINFASKDGKTKIEVFEKQA